MFSSAKVDLDRRQISHEVRDSVHKDLTDLRDWVQQHLLERCDGQTVAWFSCSAMGVRVARWLPVPLPSRLVLAEDFDDSALYGVLRSMPQVGLVLMDHAITRVYHADAGGVVEVAVFNPDYQKKIRARETNFGQKTLMPGANSGGAICTRNASRIAGNICCTGTSRHLVPHLSRLARKNGWHHLLIAGEVRAVSRLRNNLTTDLRRLDVQVVDVPVKSDIPAIKNFLRNKMDELRYQHFHREYDAIVRQALPEMRALGLPDVCKAASVNAIQMLLLESAPPRQGFTCHECGWIGLAGAADCPVCRAKLISTPHVYDNLADAVLDAGGNVLYTEKQLLPANMEHVAASLRFPLSEGL